MIRAIELLRNEAQVLRSMTTPNSNTITEFTARQNAELADEYELAANELRKLYNEQFINQLVKGIESLVDSCRVNRENRENRTK